MTDKTYSYKPLVALYHSVPWQPSRTITLYFEVSKRHCRTVARVILGNNTQGLQWTGRKAYPLRVTGYGEWSQMQMINDNFSYTCWREVAEPEPTG